MCRGQNGINRKSNNLSFSGYVSVSTDCLSPSPPDKNRVQSLPMNTRVDHRFYGFNLLVVLTEHTWCGVKNRKIKYINKKNPTITKRTFISAIVPTAIITLRARDKGLDVVCRTSLNAITVLAVCVRRCIQPRVPYVSFELPPCVYGINNTHIIIIVQYAKPIITWNALEEQQQMPRSLRVNK